MLKEQLVLATVEAAIAGARRTQRFATADRMVDFFLASWFARENGRPFMAGDALRRCCAVAAGFDDLGVEGLGHVPWYAG